MDIQSHKHIPLECSECKRQIDWETQYKPLPLPRLSISVLELHKLLNRRKKSNGKRFKSNNPIISMEIRKNISDPVCRWFRMPSKNSKIPVRVNVLEDDLSLSVCKRLRPDKVHRRRLYEDIRMINYWVVFCCCVSRNGWVLFLNVLVYCVSVWRFSF